MLRVKKNFIPSANFDAFSRECYNVIKLKNQIKRYLILRGLGIRGVATEVIESEFDYCQVMLSSLLANSYTVSMRESNQKMNRKRIDSIVEIEKQKSLFTVCWKVFRRRQ